MPVGNNERGSVLPLVGLVMLLLVGACWVLSGVAVDVGTRARAQIAADSAALAGVAGGSEAAGRAASANGARLVSFRENGPRDVTAEASIGRHSVLARAVGDGLHEVINLRATQP